MIRELTTEERNILRSEKQFSKYYLAVHFPAVVFTCELASIPSTNDKIYEIEYDGVISGVYTDVLPDMTCYVGTDPGLSDLGKVRVRKSPTSSILYIGECSEIKWNYSGSIYLTVVDEFSIWAKHPRLLADGSYYMDYDIPYSNQHTNFKPVVNMGTHAAVFLTEGTAEILFDASNSFCYSDGSKTYLWTCEGAAISDDEIANPVITITSAGTYRVACTVTVGGVSNTGYRYIFAYDDENPPVENFKIGSMSGDFEDGGWSLDIAVFQEDAEIPDNALVILFSRDYYNNEIHAIGAEEGRENINMIGWVDDNNEMDVNPIEGSVRFNIRSSSNFIKKLPAFTDGIQSVSGTPSDWLEMKRLTPDLAVYHLLLYRSTCLNIFDWYPTNDERQISESQGGETSLYDQINFNLEAIFARGWFTRYGHFITNVEQQLIDPDERSAMPYMTIEDDDWQEKIELNVLSPEHSRVELSGVCFREGNAAIALFSLSPGHVFSRWGKTIQVERIALTSSQEYSNTLAGLILGWYNHKYEFSIPLASNNRIVDISGRIYVSIPADQTVRGEAYSGKIIIRSIDWQESSEEAGFGYYVLTGECETFEENNVDGDIPYEATGTDIDYSFPPLPEFPPFPPFPPMVLPPDVINMTHPEVVVIMTSKGVAYTEDFNADEPEWKFMNNGLTVDDVTSGIGHLAVTPEGVAYITVGPNGGGGFERVLRAPLGGSWRPLWNSNQYPETGSWVCGIGANPLEADQLAIWGGRPWSWPYDGNMGSSYIVLGNNGSAGLVGSSLHEFMGVRGAAVLYVDGGWTVFYSGGGVFQTPTMARYGNNAAFIASNEIAGSNATDKYASSAGTMDKIFQWDISLGGYLEVSGMTPVYKTGIAILQGQQAMSLSPTGMYAMGANTFGVPYRTEDGGETWEIATDLDTGSNIWENCKDNNRWIFGGGDKIALTLDQGLTEFNKIGNLLEITDGFITIHSIRFVR